jgi:hypothetical protein
MKIKLYSADDIVLQTIKEKHTFESHKGDISYAGHQNKTWLHCLGSSCKSILLS